MSKIEEMKQYIERTKMSASTTSLYKMNVLEAFALAYQALECRDLPIEAISLAFMEIFTSSAPSARISSKIFQV